MYRKPTVLSSTPLPTLTSQRPSRFRETSPEPGPGVVGPTEMHRRLWEYGTGLDSKTHPEVGVLITRTGVSAGVGDGPCKPIRRDPRPTSRPPDGSQ